MLGLKTVVPNTEMVAGLRAHHMLSVPAGDNVVRLLPPLTITAEEMREGLSRIDMVASELSSSKQAISA